MDDMPKAGDFEHSNGLHSRSRAKNPRRGHMLGLGLALRYLVVSALIVDLTD
jgi:hypothetical protein